jgi:glycosyltransferase involved in cell wall biosynthesis
MELARHERCPQLPALPANQSRQARLTMCKRASAGSVIMSALNDFTAYLAQAYACPITGLTASAGAGARAVLAGRLHVRDLFAPGAGAMAHLRDAMQAAPAAILHLDPNAARGIDPKQLHAALARAGLNAQFCGRAPSPTGGLVAILGGADAATPAASPPDGFQVLAIVPVYNEADIIAQTLRDLIAQGLMVYLIDNWSSDDTLTRARAFLGRGLIAIERFPAHGPPRTYNLTDILRRVEQIAAAHPWADWVVLHDADERRRSPWPGVTLREALWRVDRAGYSCVDHVTLNFPPVDDAFDPARADLEEYFNYFEFSAHAGHFHQRRAWKQVGTGVALAASAGHDVTFPGRKVYPYKFLLKHYPVRSQAHGARKVLRERAARWNARERAQGWHRQYDGAVRFIRDPQTLIRFDPASFRENYLLQSLSGAGVFAQPPSWATPPRW